jgi:hypothetical protein
VAAPVPVITAFVATVVPWAIESTDPISIPAAAMALMTPSS